MTSTLEPFQLPREEANRPREKEAEHHRLERSSGPEAGREPPMNFKREIREVVREFLSSRPPRKMTASVALSPVAAQRVIPRRSTGWDPYEIWRTRVKAAREIAECAESVAVDRVAKLH
jgi:hypothetical protein